MGWEIFLPNYVFKWYRDSQGPQIWYLRPSYQSFPLGKLSWKLKAILKLHWGWEWYVELAGSMRQRIQTPLISKVLPQMPNVPSITFLALSRILLSQPAEVWNLYSKTSDADKHRGAEATSTTVQLLKLSNAEPSQCLDGRPLSCPILLESFLIHILKINCIS